MPCRASTETPEARPRRKRGKAVAVLAFAVCLGSLLGCVTVFRASLLEAWYLWRLGSLEAEVRRAAAVKLGELGSTRAVKRILETVVSGPRRRSLHCSRPPAPPAPPGRSPAKARSPEPAPGRPFGRGARRAACRAVPSRGVFQRGISRRGKIAAAAAVGLCLATVLLGVRPLRDFVLEEWYLWQLGSPRGEAREDAIRRLGELRSARAVPEMLRLVLGPADAAAGPGGPPAAGQDVPPELTGEDYRRPEDSSFFLGRLALASSADVRSWQLVRESLLAMGDRAVAGLNHVLQSEEEAPAVRRLAGCEFAALTRDLARRGQTTSLLRVVADRSLAAEFRTRGAYALARAGPLPDEALPVLLSAFEEDIPLLRMHAAHLLGTMGERARAAVPLLERALEDPRHFIRAAAATALGKIQENGG